jgi:hypothetical protein
MLKILLIILLVPAAICMGAALAFGLVCLGLSIFYDIQKAAHSVKKALKKRKIDSIE